MSGSMLAGALRAPLLAASKSRRIETLSQKFSFTKAVVSRFVAGYGLDDALPVVGEVLRTRLVSVDYLGENVAERVQAEETVASYLRLLDGLGQLRNEVGERQDPLPEGAMEVSVKLSAFGQSLPREGREIALAGARRVCERAQAVGALVTVDMEDHTTTDSTLSIVRELRGDFPWVGTVLQSHLRRTEADCRDFAVPGSRIRLCKGAYQEPKSVAYQSKREVDESYRRCLGILFDGPGYPMVASHDPAMIDEAQLLAMRLDRSPKSFEFQMLYGIRAGEQEQLASSGWRMRTYVPYGDQWYGYFVRRLAERPANLGFFLRALVGK